MNLQAVSPHLPCSSLGSRFERLTTSLKRRRTEKRPPLKCGRLVVVVTSYVMYASSRPGARTGARQGMAFVGAVALEHEEGRCGWP